MAKNKNLGRPKTPDKDKSVHTSITLTAKANKSLERLQVHFGTEGKRSATISQSLIVLDRMLKLSKKN